MAKYAITPWRTQKDLLTVRAQLYNTAPTNDSDNNDNNNDHEIPTDTRRQAINRIMAWKLRGNLPHAVESTALLIDAILHHQQSSSSGNSPFSIRAVYSAAFCRFVTGFCDIGRAREGRLEPSSMLDIARQIDMPVGFVSLRHEATHEELPGVGRLVEATGEALGWLWRVYWGRLDEGVVSEEENDGVGRREEVRGLLREFRAARRGALKRKDRVGADELARETAERCVVLCEGRAQMCAEVLVEDRLVFPSNRELGASMQGAFLLWDDLIQTLNTQLRPATFLSALVQQLLAGLQPATISAAAAPQSADSEARYLWLTHLLTAYLDTASNRLRAEVMKWSCLHPGHWSARLGEFVLGLEDRDDGDEEGSLVETWEDLFQASLLASKTLDAAVAADMDVDVEMERRPALDDRARGGGGGGGAMDGEEGGGWVRSALSPSVPIGVVA